MAGITFANKDRFNLYLNMADEVEKLESPGLNWMDTASKSNVTWAGEPAHTNYEQRNAILEQSRNAVKEFVATSEYAANDAYGQAQMAYVIAATNPGMDIKDALKIAQGGLLQKDLNLQYEKKGGIGAAWDTFRNGYWNARAGEAFGLYLLDPNNTDALTLAEKYYDKALSFKTAQTGYSWFADNVLMPYSRVQGVSFSGSAGATAIMIGGKVLSAATGYGWIFNLAKAGASVYSGVRAGMSQAGMDFYTMYKEADANGQKLDMTDPFVRTSFITEAIVMGVVEVGDFFWSPTYRTISNILTPTALSNAFAKSFWQGMRYTGGQFLLSDFSESAEEFIQGIAGDAIKNAVYNWSNTHNETAFPIKDWEDIVLDATEAFAQTTVEMMPTVALSMAFTLGVGAGRAKIASKNQTFSFDPNKKQGVLNTSFIAGADNIKVEAQKEATTEASAQASQENTKEKQQETEKKAEKPEKLPQIKVVQTDKGAVPATTEDKENLKELFKRNSGKENFDVIIEGVEIEELPTDSRASTLNSLSVMLNIGEDGEKADLVSGYSPDNAAIVVKDNEAKEKVKERLAALAGTTESGDDFIVTPTTDGSAKRIQILTQEQAEARGIKTLQPNDWSFMKMTRQAASRLTQQEFLQQEEVTEAFETIVANVTGKAPSEIADLMETDPDAISMLLPEGTTWENLSASANFMPILSRITGRSSTDLLGSGDITFNATGQTEYVDRNTNQVLEYDEQTGKVYRTGKVTGQRVEYDANDTRNVARSAANVLPQTTADGRKKYNITINKDASADDIMHELMHVSRAMASKERLAGFVKAYGATDLWTDDIRNNDDGTYTFNDVTYDNYNDAYNAARVNEERFVRDFMDYLATETAPNSEIKSFFEKLKRFIREIVQRFCDMLSQDTVEAFDKLLDGELSVEPSQTIEAAVEASTATLTDAYNYVEDQKDNGLDEEGNALWSLEDINPYKDSSFDAQVRDVFEKKGSSEYRWLVLSEIPPTLKELGLEGERISVNKSTVIRHRTKAGHFASADDWITLANIIDIPIAAGEETDERTGKKKARLYYDFGGGHVGIAIIEKEPKGKDVRSNNVVTTFYRDKSLEKDIEHGLAERINQPSVRRRQLPSVLSEKTGYNQTLTQTEAPVKLNSLAKQWQTRDANTQRRIDEDYERTYNQYINTDKWMKAPNSKPTNLTERQWVQIRTPAFKEWFGDWENDPENASKVVDDNGEPRILHHGTPFYGFDTFDTMYGWAWFSETTSFAKGYAEDRYDARMAVGDYGDLNKGVYDVFLNIRNPIDLSDMDARDELTNEELADKINKATKFDIASRNAARDGRPAYDGVIIREDSFGDDMTWGVWNPNQIKSATDNTGEFSTNNNILFSFADPVGSENFDAFDISKIGTGEGSQAFGWGSYVTDSPGIGKAYAKADHARKKRLNNTAKNLQNDQSRLMFESAVLDRLLRGLRHAKTGDLSDGTVMQKIYEGATSLKQNWIDNYLKNETTVEQAIVDVLNRQQEIDTEGAALEEKIKKAQTHRNLYKVEIPDELDQPGSRYLDWDKELEKEEIERIVNTMSDEYMGTIHIEEAMPSEEFFKWTGEELYKYMKDFYESVGDDASGKDLPNSGKRSDQLASELLHKLGYTGIRYEAERHTRKQGQVASHYNYVIFDANDIKILNHWTYDTDEEAKPLFSLSPEREAAAIKARKNDIEYAVGAGIFVRTEFLREFEGEDWADAELKLRDYMKDHPELIEKACSAKSLENFKSFVLGKKDQQKESQKSEYDDIPFDEPEIDASVEAQEDDYPADWDDFYEEPVPEETKAEDEELTEAWLDRIYEYSNIKSSEDKDRRFANEWTSSEDKTLELGAALANYRDAFWKPRPNSKQRGRWYTKNVWGAFEGVSTKLLRLSDGTGRRGASRGRSSSAEIQEVQNLILKNPRSYRNAYNTVQMAESRAADVRTGAETIGVEADFLRMQEIDDDIANEIAKIEAEERAKRLGVDYKTKAQDLRKKLRDAEKDLEKVKESANTQIQDLRLRLRSSEQRESDLKSQLKEAEKDMSSAEKEYSNLIERMGKKIEDYNDKTENTKALKKQLEDRRARVEELRIQLTEANKEVRRLSSAVNAKTRQLEAQKATAYRNKRIRQILRLTNFNSSTIDASFENSLLWIRNLFDRNEDEMDNRKTLTEQIKALKAEMRDAEDKQEDTSAISQKLLQLQQMKKQSQWIVPPARLAQYYPELFVRTDNRPSSWTAEELDNLLSALKLMRADGKQMLETKKNARKTKRLTTSYDYFHEVVGRQANLNAEGEMSSGALRMDVASTLKDAKDAPLLLRYGYWNAKLQRLARILDGDQEGVLYDWFVREAYRLQSLELEGQRKRYDAGQKVWKEQGIKSDDLSKEGYKGTKQNGTEYTLTRGQMLGVYIYSRSELGMEKLIHLYGNGITEESIEEIISQLTPQEIAWADFMLNDFAENYSRLKETYYRGWNMNLGERENYFTLIPADSVSQEKLEATGMDPQADIVGKDGKAYTNKSFTKAVNPNAIYPLDLDVTKTWYRQVAKQEHFIAFGEWAVDTQYLFEEKGGNILNTMSRKFDKTKAETFKKIVNNVIGSQTTDNSFDRTWTKFLAKRNSAVIIGNSSTTLKQGPSWFAAFNGDVDVGKALVNAFGLNEPLQSFLSQHPDIEAMFPDVEKATDFIYANAPEMKNRQIDQDLVDALNRMEHGTVENNVRKVSSKMFKYTAQFVDKLVVNNLWMSRYYTVFDQQKEAGKTDIEAHKEAAFKASQFISETQPTSMKMDQSAIQIDAKTSSFLRAIMVFTNQVINTFNQLFFDIPMAFRRKEYRKVATKLISTMFMIGTVGILSGKFIKRKGEDDDKYKARLWREILVTGIQASSPGFGPIVATAIERGDDFSTYIFGLDTLGKAIRTAETPSEKKTVAEKWADILFDLGTEAGYAIGVPVSPIRNVVKTTQEKNPGYLLNNAWGQIVESYR